MSTERVEALPDYIDLPKTIEQPRPKRKGAAGHFYWMSEHITGLGLRSRLTTRALAIEQKEGAQDASFVNLDHLWGPDESSEGKLVANELEGHYHIPPSNIVLREDAWSTGGEVKTFVEEARKRGWTNIVDVAFSKHHSFIPFITKIFGIRIGTIPLIYERLGLKPEYKTVEDILREKDIHRINRQYKVRKVLDVDKDGNPKPWKEVPIAERQYAETGEERPFAHEHNHTKRLIDKFARSKFEWIYFAYEGIKWAYMHKPGFNYDALEQANRDSRGGKGTDSPISRILGRRFDFDVYTLNGVKSPFSHKNKD